MVLNHICTLKSLPIPNSVNRGFAAVRGRLIKTAEARKFDQEIAIWLYSQNNKTLSNIRALAKNAVSNNKMLQVDRYFIYPKHKLFTKEKKSKGLIVPESPKKIDADNRVKPLLDAVAKIIGVDDKYFFSGHTEKMVSEDTSLQNTCIVVVYSFDPLNFDPLILQEGNSLG